MSIVEYLIFIQNVILIILVPLILCKAKKKKGATPSGRGTSESLKVKSMIKPPITDPTPSMLGKVKEEEPKKEESKEAEKKTSQEAKEVKKEEEEKKKEEEKPKEESLKPFPKFEMPTESKKKKKIAENEVDKKAKVSSGFYQEKSDEDDTLEKVDSLRVEKSDKTKRSQKKNKENKE